MTPPHVAEVISGHINGHQQFLATTFDRDNLGQLKYYSYVQVKDTDRLLCNMTFSDQVHDLDLRSTF